MSRSLVAIGAGLLLALWPAAASADATRADPAVVQPGDRTVVTVDCGADLGPAAASSPLFGEVELLRTAEPGRYRAWVTVPGRAAAGTYPVAGPCGSTSVTVAPPAASLARRDGPTYIGIALLGGGLVLAVLATRRRGTPDPRATVRDLPGSALPVGKSRTLAHEGRPETH